ncbi:AAA-4_domain protein [Hexamita inflata]|uniref:AAA-4 domain protein n=1 Tax=Hexamita inflata TaxID=28002 RepID=A0AA86NYQ2_9EUKA|nr:AAA-4 domain protein [Hexamita inflata]
MKSFQELPDTLIFSEILPVTETQTNEFKALQITGNLIPAVRDFFRSYMNAFINTAGGSLWFGIEDDSEIKGLFVTEEQIIQIKFLFQQVCSQFIPQVQPERYKLTFIEVLTTSDQHTKQPDNRTKEKYLANYNLNPSLLQPQFAENSSTTSTFIEISTQKVLRRYVIVSQILQGIHPVYVNFQNQSWIRRDAGIYALTADFIKQRYETFTGFQEHDLPSRTRLRQVILDLITNQDFAIINIYGPPGTGKNQLVRSIIEASGLRSFFFNSQKSFKEQEQQIKSQFYAKKEHYTSKPILVWDDYKYVQLWEVELLFLVYYVSNYILKYFATSNADDKFQQIISSWRLFMNYSLTQEGQKYDFDRIRPQSTIQSRYLIFQKGKIEITTCNKRTAMTKINAVEDVQGRSTNSLNKLRQF